MQTILPVGVDHTSQGKHITCGCAPTAVLGKDGLKHAQDGKDVVIDLLGDWAQKFSCSVHQKHCTIRRTVCGVHAVCARAQCQAGT